MSEFFATEEFPRSPEEPLPLTERLFQESWEKNEKDFLRRTEELISLRSFLLDYEVKPFVPLVVLAETDVFDLIPLPGGNPNTRSSYVLYPGSDGVVHFETNHRFYSVFGNTVSPSCYSRELINGAGVYDGSPVDFALQYTELKPRRDSCGHIYVEGKKKDMNLFHRHVDGIVRGYNSYLYFRNDGYLFEKKKKGSFGSHAVAIVRPAPEPFADTEEEVKEETLLLKRHGNYVFRHNGEWYECCAKGVRHVHSDTMTCVKFPGIFRDAYYYEGKLYVTTSNHRFFVYDLE